MIQICEKMNCVGCGACISACKKDAITMKPDALGFLYPVINQEQCVKCGLCVQSCFNNQGSLYNDPIETYVGYAIDVSEQISSTSGGVASVFMRAVLLKGGVVYGCSGENAREIKHIRIENPDDIYKLKGSKYVQSLIGETYRDVEVDLKTARPVLFVGTPCQVAGLKAYLKQRKYENLYTVDFVCHGVPSQQILNDAINSKVNFSKALSLVNRVKDKGKESKYTLRLMHDDKVVYDDPYPSKGYITGFLCGLYYRESCYQCKFSRKNRVSDVTLGDFWDRDNNLKGLPNRRYGLSMVIINGEAGKNIMALCSNSLVKVKWKYEDFIIRNAQLEKSIARHPNRDIFEDEYRLNGFEIAISKALKTDLIKIRKHLFLNEISLLMKRTPVVRTIYKYIKYIIKYV